MPILPLSITLLLLAMSSLLSVPLADRAATFELAKADIILLGHRASGRFKNGKTV